MIGNVFFKINKQAGGAGSYKLLRVGKIFEKLINVNRGVECMAANFQKSYFLYEVDTF